MRISDWSSDVCSSDLGVSSIVGKSQKMDLNRVDISRKHWTKKKPKNNVFDFPSIIYGHCWTSMDKNSGAGDESRTRDLNLGKVDRKRVVVGKSVSVSVDLGGRRILKKKKKTRK